MLYCIVHHISEGGGILTKYGIRDVQFISPFLIMFGMDLDIFLSGRHIFSIPLSNDIRIMYGFHFTDDAIDTDNE